MKNITDIVIPTFYKAKETFLTIEALLKANNDIRIILVHDGTIEKEKPDLSSLDTNKIIEIDLPHVGQPKALNIGFKLVESKYTVIMHNDVVINDKNWVRKAVNFLETHKEAGLVCAEGHLRVWTDETHSHVHVITSIFGQDAAKFRKLFEVVKPKEDFTETWISDSIVNVFKTGIKADERFDMIIGIDFWIDVAAKGLKRYVMKFDDGRHIPSPSYNLEAYKKLVPDFLVEMRKQNKFTKLRIREAGLKSPSKGYYKDVH